MKNLLLALMALFAFTGCTYVEPGYVGVLVYLHGGEKGVDHRVVEPGKIWVGMNEKLYLFPTFQQSYKWTKSPDEGSAKDESFDFQTADAMGINIDLSVQYELDQSKIADLFQKYRKGADELTDVTIHDMVRDFLGRFGGEDSLRVVIGGIGKGRLITRVQDSTQARLAQYGVKALRLQMLGKWRYPANVEAAINAKLEATQKAEQAENELQTATAQAAKSVAQAEGEAKANELKQKTLTRELIDMAWIEKWDGKLPEVSSTAVPMVQIGK